MHPGLCRSYILGRRLIVNAALLPPDPAGQAGSVLGETMGHHSAGSIPEEAFRSWGLVEQLQCL